ncbi:MAG: restriction endonuclease subunit S [Deferrisomatales bacterium]
MTAGWEARTLGEVCRVIGGGTPSKSNKAFYTGTIPWATVRDMRSDIIEDTEFRITDEAVRNSSTNVVPANNVVIASRVGLGKVSMLQHDTAINQDLRAIIPISASELDARFLFWWFKSIAGHIVASGTGATVQGVTLPFIRSLVIPLATLPEQHRIVRILDETFAGIATAKAHAEKNLHNARALFESHLNEVFTRRGEGWVERRLSDLCERITKGSSPKWQGIAYFDEPGILFITSENVGDCEINLGRPKYVDEKFNVKDRKSILRKGDVLTNIVGASIGRTAIYDKEDTANINQAVCLIRCEPRLLSNRFLMYLLNSPIFKRVLHDNEVNNARANLSLGFFSQLQVPTPPIQQQEELVKTCDALREKVQSLGSVYRRKLTALDALKKSILHQAFNGGL